SPPKRLPGMPDVLRGQQAEAGEADDFGGGRELPVHHALEDAVKPLLIAGAQAQHEVTDAGFLRVVFPEAGPAFLLVALEERRGKVAGLEALVDPLRRRLAAHDAGHDAAAGER